MKTSHLLTGLLTPKPGQVPSLFGAVEEWLLDRQALRNLSPKTIDWYRKRIQPLLDLVGRDTPLDALTVEHVRRMQLAARERGNASTTVKDDYGVIRAFTRWCFRQGWQLDPRLLLMEPPLVENEGVVEIYRPAEVAQLQRLFAGSLRNSLIHGLLLGTGIRLSELLGLQLEDRQMNQVEVRWSTSKGRQTRWPPLSSRLQRDWVRYVHRERPRLPGVSTLFLRSDGSVLRAHGVQTLLRRVGEQTGVHVHPHKYRHTFATWYIRKHLEEGKAFNPEQLRLILGHRSYALFPRYVHLAQQDMLVKGWDQVAPY